MAGKVGLGSILALLIVLTSTPAKAQGGAGSSVGAFHYARIYADSTGASHFSDEEMRLAMVDFAPPLPPVAATRPTAATNFVVISVPSGSEADWHPVPRRQVNVILSGEVEVEVSDGEVRRFGPGSWILGEDTWGSGHITRVVSSEAVSFLVLALAAE